MTPLPVDLDAPFGAGLNAQRPATEQSFELPDSPLKPLDLLLPNFLTVFPAAAMTVAHPPLVRLGDVALVLGEVRTTGDLGPIETHPARFSGPGRPPAQPDLDQLIASTLAHVATALIVVRDDRGKL
ncbi:MULTISPECIES: hypothetical protein [Frankia]|uniref:Uncharacterized protein n=1 Tax=Frankia alni (strain DSM 45986 / CECT 9034 / ACN14a) TaxID=326424 RepID=Q0RFS4_FRAAA|nr:MULTISPECIES: hypothetical protein [Frankia]CAJ63667.1 hypothetical protein FRAAL5027 [Frankia alni ACN14a]